IGDDSSDQVLYQELEEYRTTDPVRYSLEIEKRLKIERDIKERLEKLIKAVTLADNEKLESTLDFSAIKLNPDDNPLFTLAQAREYRAELAGALASEDKVDVIEAHAFKVTAAYKKCRDQIATIEYAIKHALEDIVSAEQKLAKCQESHKQAEVTFDEAALTHATIQHAITDLQAGISHKEAGMRDLERAKGKLENNFRVSALRDIKN